jgi:outer membrane protein assembly factor BamB
MLSSVSAQESSEVILYRGNQGRTGVYADTGVEVFAGVRWQQHIESPAFGAPVFAAGVIYVGTQVGDLHAFDAETGVELWASEPTAPNLSPIAIADEVVYVGSSDGLHALDSETGEQLWIFPTDSPVWFTAPLILEDTVYFGSGDGLFYAVDREVGEEVWHFEAGKSIFWYAASEDDLIVFSAQDMLFAIDDTGEEVWSIRRSADWMPLAVSDGLIYAGSGNTIFAINLEDGEQAWGFRGDSSSRSVWSAPVVADGVVYVGHSSQHVYALDADSGELIRKIETDDWATADLVFADGILYFGVGAHGNVDVTADSSFYAVDANTGEELARFTAKGIILNGAAVGGGAVYFMTEAGELYALE